MSRLSRIRTRGLTAVASVAVGAGALTLAAPASGQGPIGPLCGPTYQWVCTNLANKVLFGGTVCEKEIFERRTGRVCELL